MEDKTVLYQLESFSDVIHNAEKSNHLSIL